MNYWPFWTSGLALASVMLVHWLTTGRMMAVSGRFSALVNRLRYGDEGATVEAPLDQDELIRATQAMTSETFGTEAVEAEGENTGASGERLPRRSRQHPGNSDAADELDAGRRLLEPRPGRPGFGAPLGQLVDDLESAQLRLCQHPRDGLGSSAALLIGGTLTGFGTRMAGGCTSGHGLIGLSRPQPGSLLATAGFFGAGILVSFLLEAL